EAQGLGNQDLGPMFAQLGTMGALSGHVGMTYQAPFDETRRRATAAVARLAVEQARARLEQARQSALGAAQTQLVRDAAARRQLELATQTAQIAERQWRAAADRLGTGSATALAVREAEQELRSARLRVARARVDLVRAGVELDHLTGRLLARYDLGAGRPGPVALRDGSQK
ncbi:MAG: TolC family protein, partial [Deltaproteobacteria bacterium]|nr:TolC family protein [Deltaproteobacteria bacterium]